MSWLKYTGFSLFPVPTLTHPCAKEGNYLLLVFPGGPDQCVHTKKCSDQCHEILGWILFLKVLCQNSPLIELRCIVTK